MRIPILACLLVLSPALVSARDVPVLDGSEWAQLTIHERIMIRIPRPARPIRRERPRDTRIVLPTVWSEHSAPKCVPLERLTGAASVQGGDVDLELVNGSRLRAKLDEDCPALDFYSGFYVKPNPDGLICGGRDALRSRSGAACPIARFRRLVPRR